MVDKSQWFAAISEHKDECGFSILSPGSRARGIAKKSSAKWLFVETENVFWRATTIGLVSNRYVWSSSVPKSGMMGLKLGAPVQMRWTGYVPRDKMLACDGAPPAVTEAIYLRPPPPPDEPDLILSLDSEAMLMVLSFLSLREIFECRAANCFLRDCVAEGLRVVQRIEFQGQTRLNDAALALLTHNCCELRVLDLEACSGVSEKAVVAVLRVCPNLRRLNLRHVNINGGTLRLIAQLCPQLEQLLLSTCTEGLSDGVVELARECGQSTATSGHKLK